MDYDFGQLMPLIKTQLKLYKNHFQTIPLFKSSGKFWNGIAY